MAQQAPDERGRDSRLSDLADRRDTTVLGEFMVFMRANRKWWLLPIVLALLLVGVFLILASTGAAPLIYTLF